MVPQAVPPAICGSHLLTVVAPRGVVSVRFRREARAQVGPALPPANPDHSVHAHDPVGQASWPVIPALSRPTAETAEKCWLPQLNADLQQVRNWCSALPPDCGPEFRARRVAECRGGLCPASTWRAWRISKS